MSDKTNEISVDQLADVSGGTYLESAGDAKRFLENQVRVYGSEFLGVALLQAKEVAALKQAFAMCGVELQANDGVINANRYFIDGKEVSREEAWKHVESQITH